MIRLPPQADLPTFFDGRERLALMLTSEEFYFQRVTADSLTTKRCYASMIHDW
jgi:hypothetical protein